MMKQTLNQGFKAAGFTSGNHSEQQVSSLPDVKPPCSTRPQVIRFAGVLFEQCHPLPKPA
jgi:hypothetical protein